MAEVLPQTETTTSSASQTEAWAGALARSLSSPLVILLDGDLGAGKTTFVRGFVRGLPGGDRVVVQSPTFALMRRYATTPPVRHLDLYRLQDSAGSGHGAAHGDVDSLGLLDELDDGFTLVEWPLPLDWPVPVARLVIEPLSPRRRRLRLSLP